MTGAAGGAHLMLQLDKETIKGRSAYSKFSGKINLGDSRILPDDADQLLFHPLEAFPVVELLGLVDGLPEGDRPAVLGNLLEPGSPAVGEHEVRLGDPQFLLFLLRFHP